METFLLQSKNLARILFDNLFTRHLNPSRTKETDIVSDKKQKTWYFFWQTWKREPQEIGNICCILPPCSPLFIAHWIDDNVNWNISRIWNDIGPIQNLTHR